MRHNISENFDVKHPVKINSPADSANIRSILLNVRHFRMKLIPITPWRDGMACSHKGMESGKKAHVVILHPQGPARGSARMCGRISRFRAG